MNENLSKLMQMESATADSITVDCDHLFAHAGGDPKLLLQLCLRFLSELPSCMHSMRSGIQNCSHPDVDDAARQLRNSLMIFGVGNVSMTAESLEIAVRCDQHRDALQEWRLLEEQLNVLVPQVQRLVLRIPLPKSQVQ